MVRCKKASPPPLQEGVLGDRDPAVLPGGRDVPGELRWTRGTHSGVESAVSVRGGGIQVFQRNRYLSSREKRQKHGWAGKEAWQG